MHLKTKKPTHLRCVATLLDEQKHTTLSNISLLHRDLRMEMTVKSGASQLDFHLGTSQIPFCES